MKMKISALSILICAAIFNFACTPRAFEKKPPASTPAAENQLTDFQAEIEKMRTPDLKFIFAFRRSDGAAVDGEDKKFLRANLPLFYNRLVITDEDRAVIVGSNYAFPPENLDALRTRFSVEDFSAAGK